MKTSKNRKLLVSVFNPQEAREAVLGGGRIIDSEDPRSALGNIKPRNIMEISTSVLNYTRDAEIQLSTNIGEDQLLFDRSETGTAIQKSPYEIAGKAAQAAIGVAYAMDTKVNPVNHVKVGVDGMEVELVEEVLREVVFTLKNTEGFANSQVMAVLFVQDLDLWEARKKDEGVIKTLVSLEEFFPVEEGHEGAIDLIKYAVGTLSDDDGKPIFISPKEVTLKSLIEFGFLPHNTKTSLVALNDLFPHGRFGLSDDPKNRKTDKGVIKKMVDAAARAGADSIMLDTRIQTKASRISLLDLNSSKELVDLAQFDDDGGSKLPRGGVLTLEEIRFFVDYCHFVGIEANLAGSLQSYHAQQLWELIETTDQMSTRGGSSAVKRDPSQGTDNNDSRKDRVTNRNLVRGLTPPEHGGCINIPDSMHGNTQAEIAIKKLQQKLDVPFFWVDKQGNQCPIK